MKRSRSALPLPRYVLRKPLKDGWAHFFNVPTWARQAGCPMKNEPLGIDHAAAVERAETILLPAFDAWRSGDTDASKLTATRTGTLDWVFAEYRADKRFTKLAGHTRRHHETSFRLVGRYQLKNGKRFGEMPLSAVTGAVVDQLYEKLVVVSETKADGTVITRERHTTINYAMKTCRRAWNVAARRHPGKLPLVNPFAQMGLKSSTRLTPTATYDELQAFRAKAIEMGMSSLATAALIGWEWLQREADIFGTFDVNHYRPKERPNAVRIIHAKTNEENWIPLFDESGVPLHPELMLELDAIKRDRIGGLMLRRDWGDRSPWPTWKADLIDLSRVSHYVKKIIRAAGLRDELSFTSFRHGGFTEAADADLSDAEIRAQGRHRSAKVLLRYAKRTRSQLHLILPAAKPAASPSSASLFGQTGIERSRA